VTAPATRALGLEAFYQVLDNGVFRILAVAALLPVLFFTLIQVTPDELRILFGVWSWPLEEIAEGIPMLGGSSDLQAALIGMSLDLLIFELGGKYGVLFCIAATAFFVPRMLEQGSVDVLFHKPVSRTRFYLSRYVTGLLFVFLLALVSCTGAFLGLALLSGFVDFGIFTMAPALAYVFALVFPVGMLIGVMTRSTVASVLLTAAFFMFNGCVHQIWIGAETQVLRTVQAQVELEEQESLHEAHEASAADGATAAEGPPDPSEVADERDPVEAFFERLRPVLDALHFALPKTSDTPALASKLRRAARRPTWSLDESTLQLGALPEGWSETGVDAAPALAPSDLDVETVLGEPSFAGAGGDSVCVLYTRPAAEITSERLDGTTRSREQRLSEAEEALREALAAAGVEDVEELSTTRRPQVSFEDEAEGGEEPPPALVPPPGINAGALTWTDGAIPATRTTAVLIKSDERVVTLLFRADDPQRAHPALQAIVSRLGFGDVESLYSRAMQLDAPIRTNILQSVGTSLAFAALVLALGAWRLSRIDF